MRYFAILLTLLLALLSGRELSAQGGIFELNASEGSELPFVEEGIGWSFPGIDLDGDSLSDGINMRGRRIQVFLTSGITEDWTVTGDLTREMEVPTRIDMCQVDDFEGDGNPNLLVSLGGDDISTLGGDRWFSLLNLDVQTKTIARTDLVVVGSGRDGVAQVLGANAGRGDTMPICDFDNDGITDFVAQEKGKAVFAIYRASDGSPLLTGIDYPQGSKSYGLYAIDDITGDGIPEFCNEQSIGDISSGSWIEVGALGAPLAAVIDDLSGDGIRELITSDSATLRCENPVTGDELWTLNRLGSDSWIQVTNHGAQVSQAALTLTEIRRVGPSGFGSNYSCRIIAGSSGTALAQATTKVSSSDPVFEYQPLASPPLSETTHPFANASIYSPDGTDSCLVVTSVVRDGISLSDSELSRGQGGIVDVNINFGTQYINAPYRTLISTSASPTFELGGIEIPLKLTDLTINSYYGVYPTNLHFGMAGTLDPSGRSIASLGVVSGQIGSSLVGLRVHLAVIASSNGSSWTGSSTSRSFVITP